MLVYLSAKHTWISLQHPSCVYQVMALLSALIAFQTAGPYDLCNLFKSQIRRDL
jgi:hypothetical protein